MNDNPQYENSIKKLIPWIIEQIEKSPDNSIMVKVKDIVHEMGAEFEKISKLELYWGLKSVLYKYGIILETGKITKDNEALFLMRSSKEKKIDAPTEKLMNVKIDIVSPGEIPSPEKRFFQEIVEYIEDMKLPGGIKPSYGQKLKFFDATIEGSKFILESFHQFVQDQEWYHADEKVSYVSGFRDALNKFKDIFTYFITYKEDIEIDLDIYFHMLVTGVNFIQNIIETRGQLPEIINVVKDINLIKSGKYQKGTFDVQINDPERIWIAIIYYVNNMK